MDDWEIEANKLGKRLFELFENSTGNQLKYLQAMISCFPEHRRKQVVNWRNPDKKNQTLLLYIAAGEAEDLKKKEKVDIKFLTKMRKWLLETGADATLCDDDGADIFTISPALHGNWEFVLPLAELPDEALPPSLRYLVNHCDTSEYNADAHFDNLKSRFWDFMDAREHIKTSENIIQLEQEARRKRGCCPNCGHKDTVSERPAKRRK